MPTKIVIPVMGPTGAGKSTFINRVMNGDHSRASPMAVGKTLVSCTKEPQAAEVKSHVDVENRPVFLVDTPGFDDTFEDDVEILRRIAEWLKSSFDDVIIGGVIYLHDISQDRFSGTAKRNLEMFNHMCGDGILNRVIIGTSKADKIPPETGQRYLAELKEVHWASMITKGTTVHSPLDTYVTARRVVDHILKKVASEGRIVLEIQTELVIEKKLLPETSAGKQLRYTLKQILSIQKEIVGYEKASAETGDEESRKKLREALRREEELKKQVTELRRSFFRRVFRFRW